MGSISVVLTNLLTNCLLCEVNHSNKSIIYADTLGWQIPEGLMDKVKRFTTGVYGKDMAHYELIMCYTPECNVGSHHPFRSSCATSQIKYIQRSRKQRRISRSYFQAWAKQNRLLMFRHLSFVCLRAFDKAARTRSTRSIL